MNPRMKRSSLAANPVLIGAATVLIAIVAVVLAYNANSGLPFVKTYEIKAEVPDASGLIVGNDVRKGGSRIGFVSAINTHVMSNGSAGALLTLKLDETAKPLPVDSQVLVRPRSVLGLKYVQITAGHAKQMLAAGATIPLKYAGAKPVELDDFFNMFDKPTREGSAESTYEYGNAFAGRGASINRAIQNFLPLLVHAEPALRNILRPDTAFARFFPALEQAAAQVAPVGQDQAGFVTGLAKTFTAWASVRQDLMDSIHYGPPALKTATEEFPKQAKFMEASTELSRRLRPAFAALSSASPGLAKAFTAGVPALQRAPALNRRLQTTLSNVQTFGTDRRVLSGLGQLAATASILKPSIAYITPAQATCNYLGLLVRNLSSAFSESDKVGSALRVTLVLTPQYPNSEFGPSSAPANGPPLFPITDPRSNLPGDSFLHSNPDPYTDAPGQPAECEAGNEQYVPGKQMIGHAPLRKDTSLGIKNQDLMTEDQKTNAGLVK